MIIINPYRFSGPPALLLDTYPSAAAAYSLRKLRTAYSGSAIRVRRSVDNTESDIGFDGTGNLNTAALQSFVGYQNLLKYSEQFQQTSAWSIGANTLSSNVIESPIGTLTATKITESNATGQFYVSQNLSIASGGATISIYAKAGERSRIAVTAIITGNSRGYIFDLSNQTISSLTGFGAPDSYSFLDVGNGWYRCSVTTSLSNIVRFDIYCINNGTSRDYTGVLGNGIYIWGAQANTGSLQSYQLTTNVINTANGYVTTWYDQSGNSRNATQVTAANQPYIMASGIIYTQGVKASVYTDGSGRYLTGTFSGNDLYNASFVARATAANAGGIPTLFGTKFDTISGFTNSGVVRANGNNYYSATTTAQDIRDLTYGTSSANWGNLYFNRNLISTSNLITAYHQGFVVTGRYNDFRNYGGIDIGVSVATNRNWIGNIQEIIYWSGDKFSSKSGIEGNINTFYQIYWDGSQTGLLNTYSGAAAAYSLRNLSSTYTGALIRVRRSSDNAELDIYGTYQGNLDTATLLSFVGSGSGYVTTWYDQSGNGRNATQATAASQPRIVNAGVLETQNGKPVVNFIRGSSNYVIANAPDFRVLHDIFAVLKSYGTQDGYDSYFGAGGASLGNVLWHRSATVDNAIGITQPALNITNNTSAVNINTKLLNAYATSSLLYFRDVGIDQQATGSLSVLTGGINQITLGASINNSQFVVDHLSLYYNEFILYNSNQSSNRSNINSNINSYYNIY